MDTESNVYGMWKSSCSVKRREECWRLGRKAETIADSLALSYALQALSKSSSLLSVIARYMYDAPKSGLRFIDALEGRTHAHTECVEGQRFAETWGDN